MGRQDAIDAVSAMLSSYEHSSEYKDRLMMEIMFKRREFEQNLDDMWAVYSSGNIRQVVEYQKGVDQIKNVGLKVLRNSKGKHRIVYS